MREKNKNLKIEKAERTPLIPEIVDKSGYKSKKGSSLNMLTESNINDLINIGAKFVNDCMKLAVIKQQGENTVNQIRAEISKIWAETNSALKKIEAERIDWNERFEKKKELALEMIWKIKSNPEWSDDIKKAIIATFFKVVE